jgi:hypothetical protein
MEDRLRGGEKGTRYEVRGTRLGEGGRGIIDGESAAELWGGRVVELGVQTKY